MLISSMVGDAFASWCVSSLWLVRLGENCMLGDLSASSPASSFAAAAAAAAAAVVVVVGVSTSTRL